MNALKFKALKGPFLYLFLCLLLFGCSEREKNTFVECDCEMERGGQFTGNAAGSRLTDDAFGTIQCRTDKKSKSGKYAVMLTNACPYGMTYSIREAKAREQFKISVWRHVSNRNGCLVASAKNMDELYLTQHKSGNLRQGDWEQMYFDLIIPQSADGSDIKVYVYNSGDSLPVYFDDLRIEYVRHKAKEPSNETSSFIDARDNTEYTTVKIGDDWWMSENLNYDLKDPNNLNDLNDPNNLKDPNNHNNRNNRTSESDCYENNENNCAVFGRLYDYPSALIACPEGWKLPSDEDWQNLEKSIGMNKAEIAQYGNRGYNESTLLREFGNSGFNAKLSGAWGGGFYNLHRAAYFWTSTEIDQSNAWCREISDRLDIGRFKDLKTLRFSVRCIKIKTAKDSVK